MPITYAPYTAAKVPPGGAYNTDDIRVPMTHRVADTINALGRKHNYAVPNIRLNTNFNEAGPGIGGLPLSVAALKTEKEDDGNYMLYSEVPSLAATLHEMGHAYAFDKYKNGYKPHGTLQNIVNELLPAYGSTIHDLVYGTEEAADEEARNYINQIQDERLRNDLLKRYNAVREPAMRSYKHLANYAVGGQRILGTLGMLGVGYGGYALGNLISKGLGFQKKNRGWLRALGDYALRYGGAAAGGYLGGAFGTGLGAYAGLRLGNRFSDKNIGPQLYQELWDESEQHEDTMNRINNYINS